MPEVTKKRAAIAVTIRKLTEEQKVGEVVSWPKISFLPNESAVLRGSQLWEQWEAEDAKAELRSTRARRTVDIAPLKSKSKPSVVPQLKKGQTSEWDFPDFDDFIGVPQESRGRGNRGRRGGLGGRGKRGRGGGNRGRGGRGRGGKSIIDDSTGANCSQEGQKARRGGNRGGRVNAPRGNGSSARGEEVNLQHNRADEVVDWKFKTGTERSRELMNDVLLRVTSRQANPGNASGNDDPFDAMRDWKAGVKKKDSFFENIQVSENFQFHEYDKEADQRYTSAKAFRIPKKSPIATPTHSNQNKASMAVRNILSEMEGGTSTVAKVTPLDQDNLPMDEEELSMEVTEVEIVLVE